MCGVLSTIRPYRRPLSGIGNLQEYIVFDDQWRRELVIAANKKVDNLLHVSRLIGYRWGIGCNYREAFVRMGSRGTGID